MKRKFVVVALAVIMLAACEKTPIVNEGLPYNDTVGLNVDMLRPILKELYDATGGPDWKEQPNWMEEDDLNKWNLISITLRDGTIDLNLKKNGLKGILPASLASLPLAYLNLSNNELTGDLPANLGANGYLTDLELSNNNFTGNLPTSLANSRINYFSATNNRFSGEIPTVIKSMQNYRDFVDLLSPQQEGFGFTGLEIESINPDDIQILKNFYNLQSVNFQLSVNWEDNNVEDWKGVYWGGDGRCRGLSLTFQAITGTRELLQNLTTLTSLDLHNTQIDEVLDLSNMKELIYLDLSSNHLYKLPEGLEQCSNLHVLDLSYNHIKSEIPSSFNNLRELRLLNLNDNYFYGKMAVLNQLTKLRFFNISENKRLDAQPLPEWIGHCLDLMELYMTDCSFTGTIPDSWKNLVNLKELKLSSNLLSGDIQSSFKRMRNLTLLDLSNNKFKGNLPEFSENNNIISLFLTQNNFTGTIPENWSVLKQLQKLDLLGNKLTGTIPDFFLSLEDLLNLDVQYNLMAGILPQCLQNHPHINNWFYKDQNNGVLSFAETSLTAVRPIQAASTAKQMQYTTGQASEDYKAALKAELFRVK